MFGYDTELFEQVLHQTAFEVGSLVGMPKIEDTESRNPIEQNFLGDGKRCVVHCVLKYVRGIKYPFV